MSYLVFIPFILQTILITFDEFFFHIKRNLPRWERIGHPIDTLSVLAICIFVLRVPYSPVNLRWFVALSIFSCLLITKDEFVHKHHCPASEQWLHAVLFVNHPILLASLGICWPLFHNQEPIARLKDWLIPSSGLTTFLIIQTVAISVFCLYQIIYWNFLCKKKPLA